MSYLLFVLALLLLACSAPPPPSILGITIAGARPDALTSPEALATLPNLASLAARGVIYEQAISHSPDPLVATRTAFAGMPIEVVGDVGGSGWWGPTIATHLTEHGYRAAAFVASPALSGTQGDLSRGFDPYDDSGADAEWPAKRVVARAKNFLAEADGPTFVWAAFAEGGAPYTPTEAPLAVTARESDVDTSAKGLARYRSGETPLDPVVIARARALYSAELREVDTALGELLPALAKDTIVVVSAAHGESFSPDWPFRHDACASEEVLHVPLIVTAPSLLECGAEGNPCTQPRPGTRSDQLVGLMDVTPTVLALAKVPPLPRAGGHDMRTAPPRTTVWSRTPPDVAQVCGPRTGPVLSLRTPTHRVVWGADGGADAYNLRTDPGGHNPIDVPRELLNARADLAGDLAPLR